MRGGMARWKRGLGGQGVRQALNYALGGTCDAKLEQTASAGADAAAHYGESERIWRFVAEDGQLTVDALDSAQLRTWIEGRDPETGLLRGRENPSPDADLLLDATVNTAKSFSIAAMLDPELAREYDALQDRIRDRTIVMWQRELNARRGHAGVHREELSRIEVVELRHERSRSLDPHKHRHLWLNIKVRGQDGQWSNVDSRVAMKFMNLVNAEGDLAARTDPQWVAALAARGLTIDAATGEIDQVKHLVRPLSRRSNQIEANRAVKLTQWRDRHPGQEPSKQDLMSIDQWAWAHGRPDKPNVVAFNEAEWAEHVRSEITDIDPTMTAATLRAPVIVTAVDVHNLDRDLLARIALADADGRSTATGGRFSVLDIRAGAVRALAATGIVVDRALLDAAIDDVSTRAVTGHCVNLTSGEADVPQHIKNLMATATVTAKTELTATLARISVAGEQVPHPAIKAVAAATLSGGQALDSGQLAAAAAIAGTDRIVTVTGPAGAGKTTMLKVAAQSLANQGRRCVVVATTKKAASVAGREIGSTASSVHRLLLDHGWLFGTDKAGMPVWHQLSMGDPVPGTPYTYQGPRRFPLKPGDRIVVDEAGMLDLHAARALALVAEHTGAGIAMVGDHRQVMPVGHSGAMALTRAAATAATELTAVHRFRNPDGTPNTTYADLSLRMREPGSEQDARAVAGSLIDRGHVVQVDGDQEVRAHIVDRYFTVTGTMTRDGKRRQSVAIVTSTNAEAQAINEAIQQGRLERGDLNTDFSLSGQNDQVIYAGDIVQTRLNSVELGVENRELWRVAKITARSAILESVDQPGIHRTVDERYFAAHVHLAYASTVHGIQGETVDVAIAAPGVDAAGLYVGMTRGRTHNEYVTTATTREAAVDELTATMLRGIPETTVDDSTAAARSELARAARTTTPEQLPLDAPWTDSRRRPEGVVDDPELVLRQLLDAMDPRRTELALVADQIERQQRLVSSLTEQVARADSRSHERSADGPGSDRATELALLHQKATAKLEELLVRRTDLARAYQRGMHRTKSLRTEVEVRRRIPASARLLEEQQRRATRAIPLDRAAPRIAQNPVRGPHR